MQQTLFSIKATYIALLLYGAVGFIMGTLHLFSPTGHVIDQVVPLSCGIGITLLLAYFHKDPSNRQITTIKCLYLANIIAFVIPVWYFVLGATWYGWPLIEEFPPISAIILIAMSVLIFMIPKSWTRYVILMWISICAPIVLFLITHPLQLETPRGRDLMVLFGPGGALLFIVLSYQRELHDRFDRIEGSLKYSRKQADTDSLTNISNRRGVLYWLSQYSTDTAHFTGLIIDIDHFKSINDTYGHEVGDDILKQISVILAGSLSEQDCLARWGGDEFVILLPHATAARAKEVADNCLTHIRKNTFPTVGQLTCSIGVAHNIKSNDIDTIIRQADACLYIAKRQGRDQMVSRSSEE